MGVRVYDKVEPGPGPLAEFGIDSCPEFVLNAGGGLTECRTP